MCLHQTITKHLFEQNKLIKNKINPLSPLHALLQLSLLTDLWELFLVVLPHLALLGSPPRVVFYALHLLLPGFHQLIIALAKFLFLKQHKNRQVLNPLQIHLIINNITFYFFLLNSRHKTNGPLYITEKPHFQKFGHFLNLVNLSLMPVACCMLNVA